MTRLTLTNQAHNNTTVLENEFIDQYMVRANGEYVKVYLLLLRYMSSSSEIPGISTLADLLECTEKDVVRALNYWKKEGLLDYEPSVSGKNETTSDSLSQNEKASSKAQLTDTVKSTIVKPRTSAKKRTGNATEFKELLFVTEQYLGKTLSVTDIDSITYLYDTLGMSKDLIEYAIEYCVENGHKSMHYIQKVALSWHEQKITTVTEAKSNSLLYNKNCYSVLNAYGIKGRAPAASEMVYIKRWNEEYGFTLELILEACARTMNAIHQPNFEYTDSILKKWVANNVHNMEDVKLLDASYLKEKERKKTQKQKPQTPNKFNNFDSRSYNMSDLERKLLQQ